MTLSSSKLSIVRGVCRSVKRLSDAFSSSLRCLVRLPASLFPFHFHNLSPMYDATYLSRLKSHLDMHTPRPTRDRHPLIQHPTRLQIRRKPNSSQRQIRVPHIRPVILARTTSRLGRLRAQVSRDGNVGDTTDVERRAVHPDGIGEVSAEGIYEDFVLVEF